MAVALETVIYIDTFLLFVDSSLDKDFNDLYFWLNYLDVLLPHHYPLL